ncbi:host-nuclease inhibitor Gam family protein [Brevibacillus sp. AG]|uniref:host-nuclease inhibitor Gam family protein n=1 Tax=Brevibacillus sp. AG TaxID=3020891 RepID=UPI00232E0DD2|nr:host-nuclease inhibitor Gam family protein [Brevibacillus sp. AG]MDC0763460.1 host-nuclease inhibitor Gam family protein [Brevibacillus sp. AG]
MNPMQALELDELQEMEFQTSPEEVRQRFKITDLDSLNWALRKIAALDAQLAEKNELAAKEKARIDKWLHKESKSIQQSKEFLEGLITIFAHEQRSKDPKWKSESTPYGKVSLRKMPAKWDYNEELALETVQSAGMDKFIRIKTELDKAILKKSVVVRDDGQVVDPETGLVIAGVTVSDQPDILKVEITSTER